MAAGIVGTPVKATLLVRGLIVFGMVPGTVGIGGLLAMGGAAAGAAVAVMTGAPTVPAKAAAKA